MCHQNVYVVEAVSILLIDVLLGKLHVSNATSLGILLEYVEVVGSQLVCLNQHRNLITVATLSQWRIQHSAVDNVSVFAVGTPQRSSYCGPIVVLLWSRL